MARRDRRRPAAAGDLTRGGRPDSGPGPGLIKEGKEHSALELIRSLHPADMGSILVGLPRTSREAMIRVMTPDTVAWMLRQLNPLEARRVGTRLGSQMLAFMLRQLHPSQALATLRLLHPSQALATLLLLHPSQALAALRLLHPRQVLAALRLLRPRQALAMLRRILFLRPREAAAAVEEPLEASEILAHPEDTAGSLMVEQLPTVNIGGTAGDARDSLRALADLRHRITHVYVVEGGDGLRGQISMVDLALAENAEPVRALAASTVATVTVETPVEECARLRRHYDLTQLPVVDGDRLIGLVPAAALLSATVEQDTLQMQQVANVAGETVDGPLSGSIQTRLPWLTVNLGTTFLAAATITLFESTLAQVVALAAFLPVVAGQGGIGGTQTLTLIVRAIALGELVGVSARRLLVREAALGLMHGVWLGLLVAAVAMLWKQNVGLGLVLGVAMLGNMVIAGSVGAAVPLFLRRIGLDPAVASAVVVTTVTDVIGFLLFLGIATASISLLV